MSGITARTLRHYHEIGLLHPAFVGANGYRFYEQPQLLRLQEILLLRELGLDLGSIAAAIDGEHHQIEALRSHHRRLLAEHRRLDRLVRTVAATITRLERGDTMPAEELFDGFSFTPESIATLETIAIERSGDRIQPYFDEVKAHTAGWTPEDYRDAQRDANEIELRLLALMRAGAAVDDDAVFAVLDDDYAGQSRLWTPNRETYAQLGEAFVSAPELRAHLDARDPRLAEYMRDAMTAYAQDRLR